MKEISEHATARRFNHKRWPIIEFAFEDIRIASKIRNAAIRQQTKKAEGDKELEDKVDKVQQKEQKQRDKLLHENDKKYVKVKLGELVADPSLATKDKVTELIRLAKKNRGLKQRIKKKFSQFFTDEQGKPEGPQLTSQDIDQQKKKERTMLKKRLDPIRKEETKIMNKIKKKKALKQTMEESDKLDVIIKSSSNLRLNIRRSSSPRLNGQTGHKSLEHCTTTANSLIKLLVMLFSWISVLIKMLGAKQRPVEEYDAIGFDMDLCIARYKLRAFSQIIFESAAIHLVRTHGYPQELFPDDEDMDDFLSYSGRAVADLRTMYVLKLGKSGEVLRALDGYTPLTTDQIKQTYGPDAKIKGADLERLNFGKDYYFASDLFKVDYILLFIRIKELLKQKGRYPLLEEKTGWDMISDFRDSSNDNYHHYHKKYSPPEHWGNFFPILSTNPKRFLYKSDTRIFEKLRDLKKAGKVTFLLTNAHFGYFKIIFPFISQDVQNAEDIFDFIGMNGTKPLFFTRPDVQKFYRVDHTKPDLRGHHDLDFSKSKYFLEGNAEELTAEIKKRLGKEEVSVIYFGDNSTGDMECVAADGWDNAFIYEELSEADQEMKGRADFYDFTSKWGSWIKDKDVNGNEVSTLLHDKSSNKFCRAFSRVCSDQCLDFFTLKN